MRIDERRQPPSTQGPRLRRVGHKGADLIAPGNTYESFDAALAAGVDMIEFDILPERGTERLLLAHDYEDAAGRAPLTLEEGLAHLASEAFTGIELDVDLKLPGYELRVLEALRAYGVLDRTMISSHFGLSLATIRAAAPSIRLGWSVPRVRSDPFRSRAWTLPAHVLVLIAKSGLPKRASRAIRAGRCDAIMVHWRIVSPKLIEAVATAGGELYVWTVDEVEMLRRFEAMGATGVITNDPRLFAQLAA
ncbi:MAG: glycerophosphodiester phosphodiesterase [Solirubrobacterales bacterium]|nr:glycerophosphodiester phosphodiesterase [Solirubrobacterales bacterium]MBV8940271.1 glycerophosphodiester phosphodiesterase [Solirubrobacterales bacterium]MBV9166803.1 glycerophosphodiester phosphodiesterase [Solirubrobacterales bacterium]MBV9537165.1 glycerophosphodiester phosphodiesterase [Solirubrobacterales bacterium]